MNQGILEQGRQFFFAFLSGCAIGCLYDILWGLGRKRRFLMGMLDLFAGLELLVANWLLFLYVGDGEYRLFFLPGIGAGFFAWKKTLGGIIRKGSGLFWLWCFLPVAGIGRILKKFMEKQKKFLKYLFSNRKKSVKIKEQHSISGGENGG